MPLSKNPVASRVVLPSSMSLTIETTRSMENRTDLASRFIKQDTTYVTSALGNTLESADKDNKFKTRMPVSVLSALDTRLHFDDSTGSVIGVSAAVSGILGRAQWAHEAIAKSALSHALTMRFNETLQKSISDAWDAETMLRYIKEKALSENVNSSGNEGTLAGIHIIRQPGSDEYVARAYNAGNCMIVICRYIEKQSTYEIKFLSPTFQVRDAGSEDNRKITLVPVSTEFLTKGNVEYAELFVKPNDIVFLMSDGYWRNMPSINASETALGATKKALVSPSFFIALLNAVNKKLIRPTAGDYHAAIHEKVLEQQNALRIAHANLSSYLVIVTDETELRKTIQAWCDTLTPQVSKQVEMLLYASQYADGVALDRNKNTVKDLKDYLKRLSLGDDCAMTVICVPAPYVEYVRRHIELKLKVSLKTSDDKKLANAILHLADESNEKGPIYLLAELRAYYKLFGGIEKHVTKQIQMTHLEQWKRAHLDASNLPVLSAQLMQMDPVSSIYPILDQLFKNVNSIPRDNTLYSQYFGKDREITRTLALLLSLLKKSIDSNTEYVSTVNKEKYALIHHVVKLELINVAKYLVRSAPNCLNEKIKNDLTPLHLAVKSLNEELITLFVEHGADLNAQTTNRDGEDQQTPGQMLLSQYSLLETSVWTNEEFQQKAIRLIECLVTNEKVDKTKKDTFGRSLSSYIQRVLEKLHSQSTTNLVAVVRALDQTNTQRNRRLTYR